jgi:serine/threonine protein kinase
MPTNARKAQARIARMQECPVCGRCLTDELGACPGDGVPLVRVFDGSCVLDGRYQLIARSGMGGMGTVYRALHLGIQKIVAVKLLPTARRNDPRFIARFQIEAQALGQLEHVNIVRVTDFGFDAAHAMPFLVMEYLEGVPLSDHLARRGPLSPETALPLLAQVASAIDYAHAAGILHRDLKSSNVLLLDEDSLAPAVKVVDFGLAGFLVPSETTPDLTPTLLDGTPPEEERPAPAASGGEVGGTESLGGLGGGGGSGSGGGGGHGQQPDIAGLLGTPAYIAPEIWQGQEAGRASDLWAFGVLIFATLTGRLPFPGPGKQRIREQVARGAPRPSSLNPVLHPDLDPAVLAPLRTAPAARPQRATEVVEGLRRALGELGQSRWRAQEVPRRLILAALLAAVAPLALMAAALAGPVISLENQLVDLRFSFASPRLPRRDLALLLIDEPTLAAEPTPLAARADEVGTALERVFAGGARGVAVDALLPRTWSASESFSDLLLRHADSLALAAFSPSPSPPPSPAASVLGAEVADGLTTAALGPARAAELFGFADVMEDRDGVVRRARPFLRDVDGRMRRSLAARSAAIVHPGVALRDASVWIDGTIDSRGFERVSWRDLAATLDRDPQHFAHRFVLVGGEYQASGDDNYRIPHPRKLPEELSGVALQAVILQTLLDGGPVREARASWVLAGFALTAGLAGAATLLAGRGGALTGVLMAGGGWIALGFGLFAVQRLLVPLAAPLITLLFLTSAAAAVRLALPDRPRI